MKLLNYLNKTIEYSFYLLFFLVPLTLAGDTSELFEFNKLWVTFVLTIVIGTSWIAKMVIKRQFQVQKTPLDIPIALFVGSQVLSTVFSLDMHISLWGYYSRFNGGLFSILSYVFLYYGFVSNYKDFGNKGGKESLINVRAVAFFVAGIAVFFTGNVIASFFKNTTANAFPLQSLTSLTTVLASFAIFAQLAPAGSVKRVLYFALSSCVLIVLWGLPSHFGYDPTCLLFRGTFDVSCWTADFQPKIRLFSTLGQPAWYGAYLAIIVPILLAIFVKLVSLPQLFEKGKKLLSNYLLVFATSLFVFIGLCYFSILWTISRGSVVAAWVTFLIFLSYYFYFFIRPKFNIKKPSFDFKVLASILILFYAIIFFNGQPFSFLDIFTFKGINDRYQNLTKPKAKALQPAQSAPVADLAGTESGTIRLLVWKGAIDIWKNYPVFGSGLETYAFSYYKYRPVEHNLTSEWNFLYNKAHNEYLNYLATTGTVGIATYLLMIGAFLFMSAKFLFKNTKRLGKEALLLASLVIAYIGILISNFFGFSVVMINIFFYTLPAFFLIMAGMLRENNSYSFNFSKNKSEAVLLSNVQKILVIGVIVIGAYLIFVLARFWQADRYYYLGYNFDRAGDYQNAYPFLQKSVEFRPSEPVFRDELSLNNAVVASAIIYQNQQSPNQADLNIAKQLIDSSIANSNKLKEEHPNNIVFAKTRVRVFYSLGQVDANYLPQALDAIKRAKELAPNDADVSYNLGVLTGQSGDVKKAVQILEETIKFKPDYLNAYYALGLFYHQLAINDKGQVINAQYEDKAIFQMEYILKTFGPYQPASDALSTWKK